MNCPPEIATCLLKILTLGLIRIRSNADDPARCLALSDHLHNLPDLVRDYSPSKLSYYWDVERPCFLRKSIEADQAAFEVLWDELRPLADRELPGVSTSYLVVFERAGDGSTSAFVPDLPGCVGVGDSTWEAAEQIREAMLWHVKSLRRHNEAVPAPTSTSQFVTIDPP